jgi:HPt (histidine-containing phosphotransfer) domain-containing protein
MDNMIKPAFDMDHAREVTDGDTKFLKKLVEIFNADFPERLERISLAIKERDFNALDETAHSLKGSSGNLGLTCAYELSYKLENMGKGEDINGANETLKELEEELERFREFVSKPRWEEK